MNVSPRVGELRRIVDEVPDHLLQPARDAAHRTRRRIQIDGERTTMRRCFVNFESRARRFRRMTCGSRPSSFNTISHSTRETSISISSHRLCGCDRDRLRERRISTARTSGPAACCEHADGRPAVGEQPTPTVTARAAQSSFLDGSGRTVFRPRTHWAGQQHAGTLANRALMEGNARPRNRDMMSDSGNLIARRCAMMPDPLTTASSIAVPRLPRRSDDLWWRSLAIN